MADAPLRGKQVDEALAALPQDIAARLGDNATLERLVYEVFYGGPIAFASKFLVIAIQKHVLGIPLESEEDIQAAFLDSLTPEERADWWRAYNRTKVSLGDDRKASFNDT